ncbi:MAG TPA: hypothetical protein VFO14_18615 [Vicinamibacterales bacterium]|jgi:hypothetical protein|nr:hypothetical protein [Vicinamibacterales bacterium]
MHSLDSLAAAAPAIDGVRIGDLEPGDRIIVRTRNSVYSLLLKGGDTFEASGGWFTREAQSGLEVRVAGCTWGGSALLTRMIAAPGMFLEFANHVRTTRIREVRVLRPSVGATLH